MRPERLLAFLLAAYALVSAWDFSARPANLSRITVSTSHT